MKLTDKQIIKILECYKTRNRSECPMCGDGCYVELLEMSLDIINQQKAEIETLEKKRFESTCQLQEYVTELDKRLIEGGLGGFGIAFMRTHMHKLLKEMTGGQ